MHYISDLIDSDFNFVVQLIFIGLPNLKSQHFRKLPLAVYKSQGIW